jgi:hypothetical protein
MFSKSDSVVKQKSQLNAFPTMGMKERFRLFGLRSDLRSRKLHVIMVCVAFTYITSFLKALKIFEYSR